MGSAKLMATAGAATFLSLSSAFAADLRLPPPPPIPEFGGWYLRGDIGMSNQRVGHLFNVLYDTPGVTVTNVSKGFDSSPIVGFGVGYEFNSWFRSDITGEYRGKAAFRGLDTYTPEPNSGTGVGADDYYGSKSEWLVLANAYLDLGTWWSLTPFIGAGVGFSRNTIHDFRDVNVPTAGVAFGDDASKWSFAWALHAGVAYKVTPGFAVQLAYRYVDLGNARSGDLTTYNGISTVYNPMEFHGLTSHDIMLGVRWMLEPEPPYQPPPLVRKG